MKTIFNYSPALQQSFLDETSKKLDRLVEAEEEIVTLKAELAAYKEADSAGTVINLDLTVLHI